MRRGALLLVALLLQAGCSNTPPPNAPGPVILAQLDRREQIQVIPVDAEAANDPFETFNRGVYWFNADFDRKVFLPALRAYRFVLPPRARTGVGNFFSNIAELNTAVNGLLQARVDVALRATSRFMINTTAGLLGTIDVAKRMGVRRQTEDFGQTLGRWGMPSGPFLVLPILGPSSVRDAGGLGADFVMTQTLPPLSTVNDIVFFSPLVYVPYVLSERDRVNFRYHESGSPFEYDLIRYLYLKKREIDIAR